MADPTHYQVREDEMNRKKIGLLVEQFNRYPLDWPGFITDTILKPILRGLRTCGKHCTCGWCATGLVTAANSAQGKWRAK